MKPRRYLLLLLLTACGALAARTTPTQQLQHLEQGHTGRSLLQACANCAPAQCQPSGSGGYRCLQCAQGYAFDRSADRCGENRVASCSSSACM
jgi:hypothetical protein